MVFYAELPSYLPSFTFALVIYTTTDWWHSCTGDYRSHSYIFENNPLWIVHWGADIGPLPTNWG